MLFQSLVVATTGLVVCALAKELGAYLAGLTVLDGDSLYGGSVAQSEASLIECALCCWCRAVSGVTDVCILRTEIGRAHV